MGSSSAGVISETTVVCNARPWDQSDSFVLREIRPRETIDSDDSFHGTKDGSGIWAITLRRLFGDRNCSFIAGATTSFFGERANYSGNSEENFFLLGRPIPGDPWRIRGIQFGEDGIVSLDKYYDIRLAYN